MEVDEAIAAMKERERKNIEIIEHGRLKTWHVLKTPSLKFCKLARFPIAAGSE